MRKVALVFVLAVFLPSLVLAWLAVRSLRDQQVVLERQQALLYQGVADGLAKEVVNYLAERRREFAQQVEGLLAGAQPRELALSFHTQLRDAWPLTEVGFIVSLEGEVLAPSLFAGPDCRQFRLENDRFLTSCETAEVYWDNAKAAGNLAKQEAYKPMPAQVRETAQLQVPPLLPEPFSEAAPQVKAPSSARYNKSQRIVVPANELQQAEAPPSKLNLEEAEFRRLIGDETEGTLARFLQNQLKVLFWYRSPRDPQLVFGAQLDLPRVIEDLKALVQAEPGTRPEVALALLNDTGRPITVIPRDFQTDWKRPFAASEIGEALPHWEVAAYLLNPARLHQTARTLRVTLGLLIALLVGAIGVGSWLIVADVQRQLTLARQKTDFVSNVSHELKTPLTSIRMFSELLAEGRVPEPARQRHFLQIITSETARLTRLINNVLDFARLERGEKKYRVEPCDLNALVRETVESYRPHLEAHGFTLQCAWAAAPVPVAGDRDALAQVVVNLLSNAEKYAGDRKEIGVEVRNGHGVEVCILDRGLGVPRGCEERIFEQFFRAHDSLASGIQGSGLGLTLARQIARAHGGDIACRPRDGGGTCFVLRLPAPHRT